MFTLSAYLLLPCYHWLTRGYQPNTKVCYVVARVYSTGNPGKYSNQKLGLKIHWQWPENKYNEDTMKKKKEGNEAASEGNPLLTNHYWQTYTTNINNTNKNETPRGKSTTEKLYKTVKTTDHKTCPIKILISWVQLWVWLHKLAFLLFKILEHMPYMQVSLWIGMYGECHKTSNQEQTAVFICMGSCTDGMNGPQTGLSKVLPHHSDKLRKRVVQFMAV